MLPPVKQLVVSTSLTGWEKMPATTNFTSRRDSSLGSRDEQSDWKEDKRQEDVEELEPDPQDVGNTAGRTTAVLSGAFCLEGRVFPFVFFQTKTPV